MHERSLGNRLFGIANGTVLILVAAVMIIPFIYIVLISFATEQEVLAKSFMLFPTKFSLAGYRYILSTPILLHSLWVTIGVTVVGTLVNLLMTVLMAYPLARKELYGRRLILLLVTFTMVFSAGIVPTFLIVKGLHLTNTYWALIIPSAISAFNLIIIKNFFQQLPDGLEESAKIDGCNDLGILLRIVLPLSMPAIATFALFYAVNHWNTFLNAILYINDSRKWPIQVLLRQIVILTEKGLSDMSEAPPPPSKIINMAVIVFSTVPILAFYPFLQKHFAKGVLLGSVKG
ncbi:MULTISPECIES: carbohydrate ABC transporter permease [Paenibacillus]|uniref:ABC transporter permease n=1 Tax=Paenibacillus agaridevorans TaxID=171404 RepID=A0A2R5EZ91_9BACL|nr:MULTISPECIES: carbohydrate ABC transporter permease [Paenibacillus]QNK59271.1 carbohydrate ABC transporter permease [Paenibacillus sp. PAMC21692]GBG11857.1 ABC transporter permease [Paenibacillus agaridevorans]